jgi:hypothetical protein
LNATVARKRMLSALVVGATGQNVLRVVTAFEKHRILVTRADDIASACESLVREMPQVVLALVGAQSEAERKRLTDVARAVGALLVHLDPHADEDTFQQILDQTVRMTLERRRAREEAETQEKDNLASAPPPEELDKGWDE